MAETLEKILDVKQQEVDYAKKSVPLSALIEAIKTIAPCRSFYRTMISKHARGINVIAEIKKASPSAGLIRDDFDPITIAKIYQACGANALSVLTDEQFFQGHLDFIGLVKNAVELPVLRKDFIVDDYQIYQSRLAGADAILLIAEALSVEQIKDYMQLAHSLGLTTLLEVHELQSLLDVQQVIEDISQYNCLLGINNRNLKTMEVKIEHSMAILKDVKQDNHVISESGIKTPEHVATLKEAGFGGVLIGETLMRQDDIAIAFRELFG